MSLNISVLEEGSVDTARNWNIAVPSVTAFRLRAGDKGMAMDLISSRCCSAANWGPSSSRIKTTLDSRPQRLTTRRIFDPVIRAASTEECNDEECSPTQEVGKISLKWKAEEQTKVTGTYPPLVRERKWTGYVEKDTAGQTNIYAVEPTVYVSETVFSSGEAGSSSPDDSSNSAAVAFGLGLIAIASASSILLTVKNNAPVTAEFAVGYSGPPLSYYIAKFNPEISIEAGVPVEESLTVAPATSEPTIPEEAATVEETILRFPSSDLQLVAPNLNVINHN